MLLKVERWGNGARGGVASDWENVGQLAEGTRCRVESIVHWLCDTEALGKFGVYYTL